MRHPRLVPALALLSVGCAYFAADKSGLDGDAAPDVPWTPTDTGPTDTGAPDGLTCPQPDGPISLAEAWDRGWAHLSFDGTLNVENIGEHPISMERWYIYWTEESQDAAAGDADVNWQSEQASGAQVDPGDTWRHGYTMGAGPAWWCVERTQVTTYTENFDFNGARVPTPLMEWIHTQTDTNDNGVEDHSDYVDFSTGAPHTQTNVWDAIAEGPIMVVGRDRNYLEMQVGDTAQLTVEVTNLGRGTGYLRVGETIPGGTSASNFSVIPDEIQNNEDGSTTLWWEFKMPGSIDDPDTSRPTDYDTLEIEYDLTMTEADCGRRMTTWAPQVLWSDIHGRDFTSFGTPLVIACCE
jgi:hypothetical protein